jgi:hypothetical protein
MIFSLSLYDSIANILMSAGSLITGLTKGSTLGVSGGNILRFHQRFRSHNPCRKDQAKVGYAAKWCTERLVEALRQAPDIAFADTSVLLDIILGTHFRPAAEQQ